MKIEETPVQPDESFAVPGDGSQWRQATLCLEDEPPGFRDSVGEYIDVLMEYNRNVNVISRKTSADSLAQLLNETVLLYGYISPFSDLVIDAGSGNGILGFPVAFKNTGKKIVLIEPRKKKSAFLREVKEKMNVGNVDVRDVSIEEYLKQRKTAGKFKSLISRGFPNIDALLSFVKNGSVNEAVVITSENKIKKNKNQLDSYIQKTYNLPLRDHLLILKFSREKT